MILRGQDPEVRGLIVSGWAAAKVRLTGESGSPGGRTFFHGFATEDEARAYWEGAFGEEAQLPGLDRAEQQAWPARA